MGQYQGYDAAELLGCLMCVEGQLEEQYAFLDNFDADDELEIRTIKAAIRDLNTEKREILRAMGSTEF